MQTCPNCGRVAQANAKVCPNCGAALTGEVWPPSVPGQSAVPESSSLLTKTVGGDIALGVLLTIGSFFIGGLGFIGIPVAYFVVRKTNKVFARAMGWTYLALMAVPLGLFCVCLASGMYAKYKVI